MRTRQCDDASATIGAMLTPPAALHALLFASGEPLEKKRLRSLLALKEDEFTVVLRALTNLLKGSGLTLIETNDEIELRTVPEASALLRKLNESGRSTST